MDKYGGSFVQSLASAWRRGDSENRQLIKDTWAKYWANYTEMAAGIDTPQELPKKVVVQSGAQSYLVRRVDLGDRYGAQFCLTHPKPGAREEPMVEFYLQGTKNPDYDFVGSPDEAIAAGAEPLGWFVSRYYLSSLLDRKPGNGLCLHGGGQYDPSYNIEGEALDDALAALGFALTKHDHPAS